MPFLNKLIAKNRAVWNPDMYHGWGKRSRYFEGWYFKMVSKTKDQTLAIIPGIAKGLDQEDHAFIQVLDGINEHADYISFDQSLFKPSAHHFEVALDKCNFSKQQISFEHPEINGEINMTNHIAWPKHLGAPGIMGWYSFVPFMQCYHGIVSMDHDLSGSIEYKGQTYDFTGGKGYIEKDWGISFPKCWIWMQSNHFDNTDEPISCCASIAHIPWLGKYFIGFIVGILYKGKVLRFATYLGTKMNAEIHGDQVLLKFTNRKHQLEIIATKIGGKDLISPIEGDMIGKVNESMQSTMHIKLFEKENLIYEGVGSNTGLEIAGDVDMLLTK